MHARHDDDDDARRHSFLHMAARRAASKRGVRMTPDPLAAASGEGDDERVVMLDRTTGEALGDAAPVPPLPPPARNGRSLGGRVVELMTDTVCCICSPVKTLCTIAAVVAVVLLLAIAGLIIAVKKWVPDGDALVTTVAHQVMGTATDTLASIVNGATDSDLTRAAYRRYFSTMTSVVYQPEVSPALQGWLDARATRLTFSLTFSAAVDESQLGGLVLIQYDPVAQAWVTTLVTTTGPLKSPLVNRTWQQTLTCPVPWSGCDRIHAAFLDGDRVQLIVLRAGAAADQPPPLPDSSILFITPVSSASS